MIRTNTDMFRVCALHTLSTPLPPIHKSPVFQDCGQVQIQIDARVYSLMSSLKCRLFHLSRYLSRCFKIHCSLLSGPDESGGWWVSKIRYCLETLPVFIQPYFALRHPRVLLHSRYFRTWWERISFYPISTFHDVATSPLPKMSH